MNINISKYILSMISLKNLKEEIKKIDELDIDNLCNICAKLLGTNDQNIKLKCGHEYHYECMETWYKYGKTKECPYCRQPDVFQPKIREKSIILEKPKGGCQGITKLGKKCKLKPCTNGNGYCHIHSKLNN